MNRENILFVTNAVYWTLNIKRSIQKIYILTRYFNLSLVFIEGGTAYYYSGLPGDNTLYDAFAATMERGEIDDQQRRVQVCC